MNAGRIIASVTRSVPGLKDPKWREMSDAGYFSATRDGRTLAVMIDFLSQRGEMTVVYMIVGELRKHEKGEVASG